MVLQVSLAIIAAAFVVLAIYAVLALRSIRQSVEQATRTMDDIEKHLQAVSAEAVGLMNSTKQVTDDLNRKLQTVDGFFDSVGDVGQAVQQVTSSVKQVSATVSQSVAGSVERGIHTHKNKLDQIMFWTNVSLELWRKLSSLKSNKQ